MAKCFVLSNKYRTLSESPIEMSVFSYLVVLSMEFLTLSRIKAKHGGTEIMLEDLPKYEGMIVLQGSSLGSV